MMTLKARGFVEGKIRRFDNKAVEKKRTRKRIRMERPLPAASVALQRLYDTCLQVFQGIGTVPSPIYVKKLSHILGKDPHLVLFVYMYFEKLFIFLKLHRIFQNVLNHVIIYMS